MDAQRQLVPIPVLMNGEIVRRFFIVDNQAATVACHEGRCLEAVRFASSIELITIVKREGTIGAPVHTSAVTGCSLLTDATSFACRSYFPICIWHQTAGGSLFAAAECAYNTSSFPSALITSQA